MNIDEATIDGLLEAQADAFGDRAFIVTGGREVGFAELADLSRQVAAGLTAWGIGPGDRIAIAAPNGIEWLSVFFGAVRVGAIVVTLNPRYREREFDTMLNDSQARVLVCPARLADFDFAGFFDRFRSRVPTVGEYVFLGGGGFEGSRSFDELIAEGTGPVPDPSHHRHSPAVILYTSGTTGTPKGAVLTHASLLASARAQATHLGWGDATTSVGSMPLNHVGGLTCSLLALLAVGGRWVMLPTFSPVGMLDAIEAHRATHVGGVPTMWVMMLNHAAEHAVDLGSVTVAVVGGSTLDPGLARRLAEAMPGARVTNLYGLSETSGAAVLSAAGDDLDQVVRSIGVPIADFEARVVDGSGADLGAGTTGELQLRGDGNAAGYWNRPDDTAATFLPGRWVATGDMAEIDDDGHLVLRGRKKEMYIQGGFNVYPAEIEAVLTLHPDVVIAAGIGVPDPVHGEVGRYWVVARPGAHPSPDELRRWCAERMANYKVPRQIVLADELPLTPAGKVAKADLRDREES